MWSVGLTPRGGGDTALEDGNVIVCTGINCGSPVRKNIV